MENFKHIVFLLSGIAAFTVLLPFLFAGAFFASAILLITLPVVPVTFFTLLLLMSISQQKAMELAPAYQCNLIYFEDLEMNVIDIRDLLRQKEIERDVCMTG